MGKKPDNIERIIRREFSKLSFYNEKKDEFEVTKEYRNKSYNISYSAHTPEVEEYDFSYFNCSIALYLPDKAAVWDNLWLDETKRGNGWGGELIKRGEFLFKKLGMQTAYVWNSTNPSFWTHMGYPTSLKVLRKRGEKNVYQHIHDTITSMSFYKGEVLDVSKSGYRVFSVDYYHSPSEDYESSINFNVKIDLQKRKANLDILSAPEQYSKEIETKLKYMFRHMKLRITTEFL